MLKLDVVDQRLSGTISLGQINTDDDGEVNEVTREAQSEAEMFDIKQGGRTVSFKAKDGSDVNRYEFTLTARDKGELQMAGQPSNTFHAEDRARY